MPVPVDAVKLCLVVTGRAGNVAHVDRSGAVGSYLMAEFDRGLWVPPGHRAGTPGEQRQLLQEGAIDDYLPSFPKFQDESFRLRALSGADLENEDIKGPLFVTATGKRLTQGYVFAYVRVSHTPPAFRQETRSAPTAFALRSLPMQSTMGHLSCWSRPGRMQHRLGILPSRTRVYFLLSLARFPPQLGHLRVGHRP